MGSAISTLTGFGLSPPPATRVLLPNETMARIEHDIFKGRWHIIKTTLPMWLGGAKLSPTLNYSDYNSQTGQFEDRVEFFKRGDPAGKVTSILGYDVQDKASRARLTWRGNGILSLFKAEWEVVACDPSLNWMVITFGKTIATPAGMDVLCRNAEMSNDELQAAMQACGEDPMAKGLLGALTSPCK